MPFKSWLSLLGLAASAFIFNTSEFIPIGLLTNIAADFSITEAHAGMLISVYAWVVMLLSLPLMILVSRMEMRRLMLCLVGFFAAFQLMSSLSNSYGMLMASRIGVACSHSVFWAIVSPMAARMVSERHRAIALSLVATGSSIAMVFGMPIGRAIGLHIGWRMTFLSIGITATLIFLYMYFTLPVLPSRGRFSVKKVPALFKNKPLMGIFILTTFFATSYYTCYSYIEPFMKDVVLMPHSLITTSLMIFGCAGIIGSLLFSKFYTNHRYKFNTTIFILLTSCMLLLLPLSFSAAAVIGLFILWGIASTAFNISMQSEIINHTAQESTSVAMSIFSGIFNFGIGTGAFIGGQVCTHLSINDIGIVGGGLSIFALIYWYLFLQKYLKSSPSH